MTEAVPQSPWTEAAPGPAAPPLAGETRADVVIVGAGFTGLSAALQLAARGVETVVLEAVEPGFGASGRNGGQVIAGLKHPPDAIVARFGTERGERIVAFAGAAPDLVYRLIEEHGIDCDLVRAGWMRCVHGRAALPAVEREAESWRRRGAPVEMLDAAEAERRSGARGHVGAMFDRRGATLNPLAYARGLARAALGLGARIHGQSPALSLERRDGRWVVATAGGTVLAERVLLATNAYSGDLWPEVRRSIIPAYSYQIATAPLGHNLRQRIVPGGLGFSDTRRLLTYCRQDARGRLLVGGRGSPRDPAGAADFRHIAEALARLFPEAAGLEIEHRWSGRVALTLDHYPHVAELAPGLSAALGYNGRGVAMATATGAAMAEHLAGAPLDTLPLPVRPLRPIPLHGLRTPALAAAVGIKRLQDWWEARS